MPPSRSPADPANPGAPEAPMSIVSTIATAAAPPPNDDAARARGETDAGVVYTCPMHPEVQSSTPGRCPKCGMTLVPKKP
jgi:Cu+-exporting ATPase